MTNRKSDIGREILEGIREIKRGEHGRVTTLPSEGNMTKARQLRAFLGDDDFFQMLRRIAATRSSKSISDRDRALVERFSAATGIELPSSCFELYDILADEVFPPHGLNSGQVPDWIHIDALEGMSPVLGSGTCMGWKWQFRARHDGWEICAAPASYQSLDGICPFEHSERYGPGDSSASCMGLDDARYFIVRELKRLVEREGLLIE